MEYCLKDDCKNKSGREIWDYIKQALSKGVVISSIKEKKTYTINYINHESISFSAPTRNNEDAEIINFDDFETVVDRLKLLGQFNTNTSKESFKGTSLYRKRSPLFALLVGCGVIGNAKQ